MRLEESGSEAEAICKAMRRNNASKTRGYLKRLKAKPGGRLRARGRRDAEEGGTASRGPCRLQRGNHAALRHGLQARFLPELEALEKEGVKLTAWERKVVRNRIIEWRALMLTEEAKSIEEMMWLLDATRITTMRVAKLLLLRKKEKHAGIWLEEEED